MDISTGINYYTRSGKRVNIYDMDAGGERPINAAYYGGEEFGWLPIAYHADGSFQHHREHPLDIDWLSTELAQ